MTARIVAKPDKVPKAYSYVRFSTPEQREGDSQRRQIARAEDYARRHGLEIDHQLRLEDLGVSAFRGKNVQAGFGNEGKRPALAAFLEAVEGGSVERGSTLLVESLDRISRQHPERALETLKRLVFAGVTVVTLTDGQVYTEERWKNDMMGWLVSALVFIRAHEESKIKAERVKAAWQNKREKAARGELKVSTRRLPGWLKVDEKAKQIRAEPEKARVIRRIYRSFLEGMSPQRIARALNQQKQPVFGGGGKRSANPRWRSSYVAKLLDNPAVTGLFQPHEMEEQKNGTLRRKPLPELAVQDYFPRVIPQEQFEAVRLVRSLKNAPRGRHVYGPVMNIFGGLARCPRCGETVTRVNKGSKPKGGSYLVCTKAKDGKGCKYRMVRYDRTEQAFLENIQQVVAEAPAGLAGKDVDKALTAKEAELAGLGDALENVLDAFERGPASPTLLRRLRGLEANREALKGEVAALRERVSEHLDELIRTRLRRLQEAAESEPIDRRELNGLLRQLLESVTVDYRTGQLILSWKQGGETWINFMFPGAAK